LHFSRRAVSDIDRIVVVSAGFGVWRGGKCFVSGRWSDVAAIRLGASSGAELCLRDGSVIVLSDGTPGLHAFLSAARSRVAGVPTIDR
jgi:hypothetical protein